MTTTGSTARIDALRVLVAGDGELSRWAALNVALAACSTDEEAETAFLGAAYFTQLRPRSQETMAMVMEARRRGLPYEITVTDDPGALRPLERYDIELAMIYPARKNLPRSR